MRAFMMQLSAAVCLLLFASGANAQRWEARYREPLDRVLADLDRAARDMGPYIGEDGIRRIRHARQECFEFQRSWERGNFNKGQLDDVIASVQHVIDRNRLRPQDRDILWRDVTRLREFRAERGRGYR